MVQEEQQHQKYNNNSSGGGCGGGCGVSSNGGGRSSKKLKQKKIPQRGLGVAQLEKIRLEEQQQKDVVPGVSSPCFVIPLPPPPPPPPPPPHQSSSSSAFPASSIDTASLFGNPPTGPVPTLDLSVPPQPPPPSYPTIYGARPLPSGGGNGGHSLVDTVTPFTEQGHYSSMWNELNYNGNISRLDHGVAYRTYEDSFPIWHSSPPVMMDRKQPQSSTKVNFPSVTSFSSGHGSMIELPLNQSCLSNSNYTPPTPWPDDEKMVGIKRPWPFALDNLPLPSKLPSIIQPIYRPEEPYLCGNNNGNCSTFKLEPGDCIISENISGSTPHHANGRGTRSELNLKNGIKENGTLQGDFLTLGPPAANSSLMVCKSKKQLPLASFPPYYPIPECDLQSSLASIEDPLLRQAGSSIEHQQTIHNFFPPKGHRVATTTNEHRRIEAVDTVDLNLRL